MNKPKVMGKDYIFRGIMPQRSQRTFFSNVYDDSDGLEKYALGEVYGGYWVVDLDLEAGIVILNRVEVAIERENCRIV